MSGSSSAKSSQSGLGTLRRDFSSSSLASQPTEAISPPTKPLTASDKRMASIQAAIAKARVAQGVTLADTNTKKRPSESAPEPPTKKKRQLPGSWDEPAPAVKSRPVTNTRSFDSIPPATAARPSKSGKIELSEEQKYVKSLVLSGKSIFYTGSAGTGKSVLLRDIITALKQKYARSPDAVAITASTGIAACNIGGVTVHSFAGVGIAVEPADVLASKVRKNQKAAGRWQRTKVLIIDEVSMVDGDFFDKLSQVGSKIRRNEKPFGGIQLIVTGDFFQLPPVMKGGTPKFAFEAKLWKQAIELEFNLTKVFRQSDETFIQMLNEMRFGRLSQESIARFKALSRPVHYEDGLEPTELFPRREDVDRANSDRLRGIEGSESRTYVATDGGPMASLDSGKKLLSNFMSPERLTLRTGAQVMLIKNKEDDLVNGSIGTVLRFVDPAKYGMDEEEPAQKKAGTAPKAKTMVTPDRFPEVEFKLPNGARRRTIITGETSKVELPNGEVQVSRNQLPLILAWAMSIHKSQGQTLDRVKVDLGKVFEKGQAYVALSRATSLEGLQVLGFDSSKVMAHSKVIEWSKTLKTYDQTTLD
ncbi:hypothetical protein CYLTODRAFT_450370 [Cylindrobasidium torrendii FP15055 ss-10]|uniref:ATP-dependent DNA helicase PIF1 n=1 Tax=Cylindrobasidium torrendii FP15055 ss-10 TaxID=1314674 RepID=A0A0D7BMU1_9AGAR|nr:hypothetical protein CYLTODRAFT_450370 [Cylindrobasidium torrendii FP15055 ss-10]